MFEQELELEQKEGSGFGPVFIIVAMVAILIGGIGYFVIQTTRTLKVTDATPVIELNLKAQPPAVVKFHAGHITPSMSDSPENPQYALLANVGIVTVNKDKKNASADVALTPDGEKRLSAIPGVQKKTDADGSVGYVVPLATRKLVRVDNIVKLATNRFRVEFSWQWQPNELGEVFDAAGPDLKKFNTWDRARLIDKFGADFYHAEPTRTAIIVVKGSDGWELAKE